MYLYSLVGGWGSLPSGKGQQVYQVIKDLPLFGNAPEKFGFVKVYQSGDGVIFGFFAQQYPRVRVHYDDLKQESSVDEDDFERYFFVLQLEQRRLFLQRRRRNQPGLPTWQTVYERFLDLLRLGISQADLRPPSTLAEASEGYSREEFVEIFKDPTVKVTFLDLADLDPDLLPMDFKFFNPDVNRDRIYKDGNRIGAEAMERLTAIAKPGANLRNVPELKGYVETSQKPIAMRITLTEMGPEETIKVKQDIKIEVDAPPGENAYDLLARTLEAARGIFEHHSGRERHQRGSGNERLKKPQLRLIPDADPDE